MNSKKVKIIINPKADGWMENGHHIYIINSKLEFRSTNRKKDR